MKRLYILTLCSLVLAGLIFFLKKREATTIAMGEGLVLPVEWLRSNAHPITAAKDTRPPDQTFLTYPEWYLVFSPEEQAHYFRNHTSTNFPFMAHTNQIWESYKIVNDQIKGNFPYNDGYHFMIRVIGTSATVEYSVKAWYETVLGRLTDTEAPVTDEDKFNARFTQEYVDFIKDRPWYEFDFKTRLKELWTGTSFFDENMARKLERKYILTSELMVKYAYGKLIGFGTKQMYDDALPTTAVVLENDSVKCVPRYDKFAKAVTDLAKAGHRFKEIAGNSSAIIVTVIVPSNYESDFKGARTLFIQPIASDLSMKRVALAIPVNSLHDLLLQIDKDHVSLEHVFDY